MFQSFNMEVYEKEVYENFLFKLNFRSGSIQQKLFILQHIWLYIMISSHKEIRPMLILP